MTKGFRIVAAAALLAAGTSAAASAQTRMADRMTTAAINVVLSDINSSSCSDLRSMLSRRKTGSSSGSGLSSRLKSNPRERQRFVNAVAGPLLNKMIDCDLVPGRR